MNRPLKIQLSNVKKAYLYSAIFSYGTLGLFWLIAILFDGTEFVSNLTTHPLWLNILTLILGPFSYLALLYALFDGLMFFDTAVRFGISRKSYFTNQVMIYIALTVLLIFGNSFSETPWTGTASAYFNQLRTQYLSLDTFINEFIRVFGLGVITLAVYRFRGKALITIILTGPLIAMTSAIVVVGRTQHTVVAQAVLDTATFMLKNPNLTGSIIIAILIVIYYLFVTKIEVQE